MSMADLFSGACLTPENMIEYNQPFIGSWSFHKFNTVLSAACTVVTSLLMGALMWEHACHLTNPTQQVRIMRICHMLPAYAGLSLACVAWPNSFVYISGWQEVWQALALYSFFLLMTDFLAPTDAEKFSYFGNLKVKKVFRKGKYREGVSFLKLSFYCVLQYPVVVFICAIAQCVTQAFGWYCLDSDSPKFGHIWTELFSNLSVTIAINAIIRFYGFTKNDMKERHPLRKLLAFKTMIGLIFFEQMAFLVLESTKVLKQTSSISYADIHIGLPNMIICVQMVPFALLMRWAYNPKEYKLNQNGKPFDESSDMEGASKSYQPTSYQGGFLGYRAWLSYLNPLEIVQDSAKIHKLLRGVHVRKQTRDSFPGDASEIEQLKDSNEGNRNSSDNDNDNEHETENHTTQENVQPAAGWQPISQQAPIDETSRPAMSHQAQPYDSYGEETTAYNNQQSTGYGYSSMQPGQRYY